MPESSMESKLKKYAKILNDNPKTLSEYVEQLDEIFAEDIVNISSDAYRDVLHKLNLTRELEIIQRTHKHLDVSVNKTLDSVRFACSDSMEYKHFFTMEFEKNSKVKFKNHTLPEMKALSQYFEDLNEAINAFQKCLFDLKEYLEVMNSIDVNCWVIDPVNPTCRDNYRRIVLDKDVTALLTIDILCANKPPHVKLLGLNKFTNHFLTRIQSEINEWDTEETFILNLQHMFGLPEFPYKSDIEDKDNKQSDEMECCICFDSHDENGSLPSIMCENCNNHFHTMCLYQWLAAVSSNLQHFNTIHGKCPNCSNAILCPIVHLM